MEDFIGRENMPPKPQSFDLESAERHAKLQESNDAIAKFILAIIGIAAAVSALAGFVWLVKFLWEISPV